MKREYVRPMMRGEIFVADEYVAACGDKNRVYKFTCDAGGGWAGSVYLETNGIDGLQKGWGGDEYLSPYHACGTTHEAKTTDAFLKGYYVPYISDRVTPVMVWRGPNNDNTHCTKNLNMDEWETAKS